MRMRKWSVIVVILLFLFVFLSSCGNSSDKNEVVKNVTISHDAEIARTMYNNGGLFLHFQVPKDDINDIHIYLYHNCVRKEIFAFYDSPPSSSDYNLYIADETVSNFNSPSRSWICYENGSIGTYKAANLSDNRSFNATDGLGKMNFKMQKDKSYILAYEAFTTQNAIPLNVLDMSDQSVFETALKQGKYSEYEYIYLVTINLSQHTK
jgi:hypothetical protein